MNILMLSERWFPTIGGGEEHIHQLTKELVKLGCKITLISRSLISDDKRAPDTETLYDGNLKVHRLMPTTEFESLVGRALYVPFSVVKSITAKERFDLMHAQSFTAGFSALMLKKIINKPAVCTVHGIYQNAFDELVDSKTKAELYKKVERFVLFREYDKIITVDKHFINLAKEHGYPLENVRYIPNGVDIDNFPTVEKKLTNSILYVGRFVPQKGLEYLIRASRILKDRNIEHQIWLVGDGPLMQSIRELASKLEVDDVVKFLGRLSREDLVSRYSRAGLFVLPSLWEGLPITLLEAWAARLPVIATKVGGIPDVCVHNENSILVEPKDPKGLADALQILIEDRALSEKISTNGRKIVEERFTWRNVAERTLEVYKELAR